jgi:hypothetical protein
MQNRNSIVKSRQEMASLPTGMRYDQLPPIPLASRPFDTVETVLYPARDRAGCVLPCRRAGSTCVYSMVVLTSLCPRSSYTVRMS